jgi:hypothetical protein
MNSDLIIRNCRIVQLLSSVNLQALQTAFLFLRHVSVLVRGISAVNHRNIFPISRFSQGYTDVIKNGLLHCLSADSTLFVKRPSFPRFELIFSLNIQLELLIQFYPWIQNYKCSLQLPCFFSNSKRCFAWNHNPSGIMFPNFKLPLNPLK